ncbi:MAG: response regulator, partial [Defluviitaleaceae bacterium]|nr:response regulator [Defluviitaleaceae bacterium]
MENNVILCVEDNVQTQMFNKPLLESKGFAVRQAMTLAAAREALKENPCLIILDIHLPDGNGLDFLQELR